MRLVINNFACLKAIDIVIDDVTTLIGEQASGKSVTSKVYHFLRDVVSDSVSDAVLNQANLKSLQAHLKQEFIALFPEYSWKSHAFTITAHNVFPQIGGEEDIWITYTPGTNGLRFGFSDQFKVEFKKLTSRYKKLLSERENAERTSTASRLSSSYSTYQMYSKALKESGTAQLLEDVTYIPSGRSFFSTIKDNVFGFLSENIGIDPFLKNFGRYYEYAKRASQFREPKNKAALKEFDSISQTVIKGSFSADKKEEWIVSGERKIALSNASSGQQEALPLIMVLRHELFGGDPMGTRAIIVEEPEAHLFPASQKAIVNMIFLVKKNASKIKFIVTTHSPYVLSCINNSLLKANGEVKVSAYYIANGTSTPITDGESGLINGEELDKISSEIAEEFYAALGLDQ